ncbi:hypothetical protein HZA57_08755 [Candidatus Poribacteria bacterium]|nr:hypothetical protein [Candidatus Poribacteria bacterium]
MQVKRVSAVLFAAIFAGSGAAAADEETSGTLTLEAIFQEPAIAPVRVSWQVYDPDGPPFVYPGPEYFRIPPTPEPAPAPPPESAANLPRLAPRGMGSSRTAPARLERGLFIQAGVTSGRAGNNVTLRFANESLELRAKVMIEFPGGRREPLTLILPPGSSDAFDVPPGQCQATREVWRPLGENPVREVFAAQELEHGRVYSAVLDSAAERELMRKLDQANRRGSARVVTVPAP